MKFSSRLILQTALVLALLMPLSSPQALASEQQEREVDHVALASQSQAVQKLAGMLKKYRNTRQEPILLSKIADLEQQRATLLFRIAHGRTQSRSASLDMSAYQQSMKQSINHYNELIAKYPRFEEIPQAYFKRGKAYEEISKKDLAARDYQHLITHHPDAEEVISATMSLAEFSIEANNHAKAIAYLSQVEKRPDDAHYPFALYKLGWSHYNLKNIPTAMSYVEKSVAYYNAKASAFKPGSGPISSDEALRENVLLDAALFYMEGFNQRLPQYGVAQALDTFKKLDPGPLLGRMTVKFSKLLRSAGEEQELNRWKDLVLANEADRPESLEVLLITYENQLNKRRYKQLVESAKDMIVLYKNHPRYEGFPKAQKMLLDTAEGLQKIIVKNKGAEGLEEYCTSLASIYDAFTRIVDEKDPRIPGVHYNLAETLFEIKDFAQATEHYRWVVEREGYFRGAQGRSPTADAGLKAIASRYEVLRQKQLIPTSLVAQPISSSTEKAVPPLLEEWVGWIDTHISKTRETIDNFSFEAARALYAQGQIQRAIRRIQDFAVDHPSSKFAIPAASLTLDTWVASQDWQKVNTVATEFLDVKAWKDTDFAKKLYALAADSFFKLAEIQYQAKDYSGARKKLEQFTSRYPKSQRLPEALAMAGAASQSLGDPSGASQYYSRLIQEAPQSDLVAAAFLNRALIEENRYQFAESARDYRQFLALPPSLTKVVQLKDVPPSETLRKKTLALAWLSGSSDELKAALSSPAICPDSTPKNAGADCDRYQALSNLSNPTASLDEEMLDLAFDRARKGPEQNRAIWGTLALQNLKGLPFRDRLLLVRQITQHWESLDGMMKFALLPHISHLIPRAFQLNRASMNEVAPLRPDERYITRRVEVIREMENAATKVMKMPWARVRALVLSENASLYLDLSKGLAALAPPKGLAGAELATYEETIRKLVLPFEEKGQDMRSKAFQMASLFSIEEDSFKQISEPFFQDNPSQAQALKPKADLGKPQELDLAFLDRLDRSGDWDEVNPESKDPLVRLKSGWIVAIRKGQWHRAAFFLQEASEKSLLKPGVLSLAKAVTYAQAGARSEGLLELEEGTQDLEKDRQIEIARVLVSHSFASLSKEKTQARLQRLLDLDPSLKQGQVIPGSLVGTAGEWSGLLTAQAQTRTRSSKVK